MAYLGIGPASFTNNLTNVQILDDIKSQFNGSKQNFDLTSNDIPFQAVSDRALMVILGGVIQAPGVDYTINGDQITFTTAPVSGLTFYARNIYGLNALNAVNDGIVGPPAFTPGGPTWDSSGNVIISGNLTVQGATTTIQSTTLDVIDKDIKLASNQSTNAGIDTAGLLWGTTAVKLKYYNNGGTNPGLNIEGTNVGIGTTAPTEKLHVTGTIKVGPNDTATRSGSVKIGGAGILSYSDNHGSSGNVATVVLENSYGAANSDIHVKQRGDFEVQNLAGHAILRVDTAWTNSSVNSGNVYLNYKSGSSGSSVETRLETTSTGVTITGTPIISNLTAGRVAYVGSSKELVDSANLTFDGSTLNVNGNTTDTPLILNTTSNNGSHLRFQKDGSNQHFIGAGGGFALGDKEDLAFRSVDNLIFGVGTSEKARITSGGNLKLPDDGKIEFGGAQTGAGDLQIYHAAGADSIIHHTATSGSTLRLRSRGFTFKNQANSQTIATFNEGDACKLFFNGNEKIATTNIGATVTGEIATTQDYPTTRPIFDWNFAAIKKLDSRIRFMRSGVASYVDEQGIIRYASENVPRFDHHPTTGECLGLLLEPERHNKQEYSVLMSEANHKNAITVTDNFTTSPDGTQNASKIVGGSSDASTNIGWNGDTVPNGQYGSWSIFVKTEISSCILQFYTNTYIGGAARLNLELADGTTGGDANSSTWRWRVDKYPNGWYRVTWGGNGANAGGGMYVGVVPSKTSARGATCGSATGKIFYAWGIQEEFSSMSKTSSSYIPTYGAAGTRGADGGTIDGDDFNDFFDRNQGTVVHEFANSLQDAGMGGGSGWEFNNSDYQKNVVTQISSGYAHSGYPGAYAVCYGESADSGDNNISLFGAGSAPNNGSTERHGNGDGSRFYEYYRDAMSWDVTPFFTTNTLRVASGGVANQGTNTSNISLRKVSAFEFQPRMGHDMDGSYQRFSGWMKRWMYYDKVMSLSQLATMTNGSFVE